jgi:hypothetical protein
LKKIAEFIASSSSTPSKRVEEEPKEEYITTSNFEKYVKAVILAEFEGIKEQIADTNDTVKKVEDILILSAAK